MKVLVIGAAGKTGREVVEQAKAAGHEVTAFVHDASGYDVPGVRVVAGDAADADRMREAVHGQDAVVDTVGSKNPFSYSGLETTSAQAVIDAMRRTGVRRLVVTSMVGEGDSTANTPWYDRLLVSTVLRGSKKDKAGMEAAVAESGLDWVVLRPAILTDGPAIGTVRVYDPRQDDQAHTITRADVAAFALDQLASDQHVGQTVTIANR